MIQDGYILLRPRQIPESILRPAKATLLHCPRLPSPVIIRRPCSDEQRHQVVHEGVSLPRVGPLANFRHPLLPHGRINLDRCLDGIIETHSIRQRSRVSLGHDVHVAQVVYRHARANDDNALLAKARHGAAEGVVVTRRFGLEEGDLYKGYT